MLRDKEYETATVLNTLPPMSNPLTVAQTAVHTAQRRRIGRVVVMLSGVIGAIIIGIVGATMVVPGMYRAGIMMDNDRPGSNTGLRTETMSLSCLSPQQAGDIIVPYIRSNGSRVHFTGSGISAITVRGTADELAKSRDLIRAFEQDPGAACRAPATTVGKPPQTPEHAGHAATSLLPPPSGNAPSLLDPNSSGASLLTPDKATTPPKR